MDLLHFQCGDHKRRPNLALVFVFILCCSIFCYGYMFAFILLGLVFQYLSWVELGWVKCLQNDLFVLGGM